MTCSTQDESKNKDSGNDNFDVKLSCLERIAFKIIEPQSRYKIAWDMLLSIVYLICFAVDSLVFAFRFTLLDSRFLRGLIYVNLIFVILNILVTLMTGL